MPMGPAEIVASLKELCEAKGPRLSTEQIVAWIDRHGGYESDAELIAFAKKMKARQYARMLDFEDEEIGPADQAALELPRPRDAAAGSTPTSSRCPTTSRRKLIRQYAQFVKQLRTVRRAMADYFAGQQFFDFYPGEPDDEDEVAAPSRRTGRGARANGPSRPLTGRRRGRDDRPRSPDSS